MMYPSTDKKEQDFSYDTSVDFMQNISNIHKKNNCSASSWLPRSWKS